MRRPALLAFEFFHLNQQALLSSFLVLKHFRRALDIRIDIFNFFISVHYLGLFAVDFFLYGVSLPLVFGLFIGAYLT